MSKIKSNFFYSFTCVLRDLWRRKPRTFSTIAGYSIAICFSMVLLTLVNSSKKASTNILTNTGTHFMVYVPDTAQSTVSKRSLSSEAFIVNSIPTKLIQSQAFSQLQSMPSVKAVGRFLSFRFYDSTLNQIYLVGGFQPDNPDAVSATCCADGDVKHGRFLTLQDKNKILIHESFAVSYNFKTHDQLSIENELFEIVGIVNPGVRPAYADVYMPIADAERIIAQHRNDSTVFGSSNAALIEVNSSRTQDKAIAEAQHMGYTVCTYACYKPAATVLKINDLLSTLLIGCIALGVIAFAIKTQLSTVIEARRDIGILRSLGFASTEIVTMQMIGALLVSITGTLLGFLVSLILFLSMPKHIIFSLAQTSMLSYSANHIIILFLGSSIGGCIAGCIPAYVAVSIKPVEALRRL